MSRVAVIGAGISGLTFAYYFKKRFPAADIQIFEESCRSGGWIQTSFVEDFLFEEGPRGVRPFGPGLDTVELIKELGLDSEVIEAKAKKRYVLLNGKLSSTFRPSLVLGLLKDLFTKRGSLSDESIWDFAIRRFGRKMAEELIDPLVTGIYAGDPKKLSYSSCFPKFFEWERKKRSILLGMLGEPKTKSTYNASLISFKKGMETLPNALASKLSSSLHLNEKVLSLTCERSKILLHLKSGRSEVFDHVFIASSPQGLKGLGFEYPVESESLALVSMGWNQSVSKKEGFGYLVPRIEKRPLLGVVFDSDVFPEQNKGCQTRLTAMIGSNSMALSDSELKKIALDEITLHLGIDKPPDVMKVMRKQGAIAQYDLSFAMKKETFLNETREKYPRVHFLGSAFSGVSVNDLVQFAKNTSRHIEL